VGIVLGELYALQDSLSRRVSLEDSIDPSRIRLIAGCDLAYSKNRVICAAVVLEYPSLEVKEENVIESVVSFPYIPTLLAFREVDPIIKAVKEIDYDVLLIDGHGIAHPRGLGIASHVGVLLDKPTIGVAKSKLCGEIRGDLKVGLPAPLIYDNKEVGFALITKRGTKPIFVSPGHKISLSSSVEIVKRCVRKHKLPEPSRIAHMRAEAAKVKRQLRNGSTSK
jgi:deoxyribonuclease V